jgi:hypothetical protein
MMRRASIESTPPAERTRPPIVVRGRVEPLAGVPFHHDGPLTRWQMASAALHPDLDCYVAVHQFSDVAPANRHYCDVHVHEFDEVNVFHSTSALRVSVRLGDDTLEIEAPTTIVIPAGTPHAANVISGSGIMVAFLMSGTFRATRG